MNAQEALERLKKGNEEFVVSTVAAGDYGKEIRLKTSEFGQKPFAIVICCSDSRVVPEQIFSCGLGELFTIRVAGNVLDNHQMGSVEYAAAHLHTPVVVVMGHTKCGAVNAAIAGDTDGFIKKLTDEIALAIGDERDDYKASCLNVHRCLGRLRDEMDIDEVHGVHIVGAMYDIESGSVEWLDDVES